MLLQLTVASTSQKWRPDVNAMLVSTSSSSSWPLWLCVNFRLKPIVRLLVEYKQSSINISHGLTVRRYLNTLTFVPLDEPQDTPSVCEVVKLLHRTRLLCLLLVVISIFQTRSGIFVTRGKLMDTCAGL